MHPFSSQEAEDQIPANASLGDLTELSGNGHARQFVPANAVGMVSAAGGRANGRTLTTAEEALKGTVPTNHY